MNLEEDHRVGFIWKNVNEANDNSDVSDGVSLNFSLYFWSILAPVFTLVCAVAAVAAIGGGITLWALNIDKAAALREFLALAAVLSVAPGTDPAREEPDRNDATVVAFRRPC